MPPSVAPLVYSFKIGISAICNGTTINPTTRTNITCRPRNTIPREGVRGERGDHDRDHRGRDRHREAVEERVLEPAEPSESR